MEFVGKIILESVIHLTKTAKTDGKCFWRSRTGNGAWLFMEWSNLGSEQLIRFGSGDSLQLVCGADSRN